jgi:hypothetical protein
LRAASGDVAEVWLSEEIRQRHGWLAFQQPDKIADAIRLISDVQLWPEVATRCQTDIPSIRARVSAVVERRNKIVHEADIDPSFPDTRWPISETDAADAVTLIEDVVSSIHDLIS